MNNRVCLRLNSVLTWEAMVSGLIAALSFLSRIILTFWSWLQ